MSFLRLAAFLVFSIALWTSVKAQDVAPADANDVQAVISDQLSAFKDGDIARAYSHAAPSIKGIFPTPEKFETMVQRGYGAIYQSGSHVFGRNAVRSEELYQEVIVTDQNGKQWQAVYSLKKQGDGSWKITGVKMNPYTGAST